MIYTVGEMAQKLGVPASTLRYYDKEGLLPFVERSSGGIRMFRENDFEWLQVIRCMKKAGMSIILLDEATASLDPENEVLVQKAIAKLVEGKTVIMIAHRLRTVVDADQILVLDNGRLVEHGTHDELMKKNGLYAQRGILSSPLDRHTPDRH